jgi:hypothetical protein
MLISSFLLFLDLTSSLLYSGIAITVVNVGLNLTTPTHATCPVHRIFLDLITQERCNYYHKQGDIGHYITCSIFMGFGFSILFCRAQFLLLRSQTNCETGAYQRHITVDWRLSETYYCRLEVIRDILL